MLKTFIFLTFLKLLLAYQFIYGPCHFHIQISIGLLNEHLNKALLPTLHFGLVSKLLPHLSSSSLTATQGSRLDPTQQMDWVLLSPRGPGCLSRRALAALSSNALRGLVSKLCGYYAEFDSRPVTQAIPPALSGVSCPYISSEAPSALF